MAVYNAGECGREVCEQQDECIRQFLEQLRPAHLNRSQQIILMATITGGRFNPGICINATHANLPNPLR